MFFGLERYRTGGTSELLVKEPPIVQSRDVRSIKASLGV